jgi:hypothetical protein
MTLVVRRREITDAGHLQTLVIDHVEGFEPGLAVLDSRLLLGQATIDVVGLDTRGALVLIAVGASADEEMLLKAVEAYSWCLEYPEAIRRLYPAAQISSSQPPRLMFIVERMPDSFHRKIKQLGFPEVDCIEFRYLDVDGTPAVYFDALARLRRAPVAAPPVSERVMPPAAPATNGRPTSLKLQKLLGAERPALAREPAHVVSLVHRTLPRADAPRPATPAPETEMGPGANGLAAVEVFPAPTTEPIAELVTMMEPPSEERPIAPIEAAEPMVVPEPALEQMSVADDEAPELDGLAPVADLPDIEPVVETLAAPEEIAEEPDSEDPVEPAAEPDLAVENVDVPQPVLTLETIPEPTSLVLETADVLDTPALPPVAAPAEAAVADVAPLALPALEPVAPPRPAPAPSVFARRAVEGAKPPEPKVSFADVAKDLLSATGPTPQAGSGAMPRAALDQVGGTAAEKPVTAFAKPAGAFARPAAPKPPRTIAPPPADPNPIAGGPKLGAASKRAASETPAAKPETTTTPEAATEPPAPAPPPQGFEGLQFPNDGVLTRQWMEFLNQMAAGK